MTLYSRYNRMIILTTLIVTQLTTEFMIKNVLRLAMRLDIFNLRLC